MPNGKTWVLVTDTVKARIFAITKAKFLQNPTKENFARIAEYIHEESREHNRELVSDRAGLYGTGSFEPRTTPKEHEAEVFTRGLINTLETARAEDKFRDLIIVASANMMGLLNKHMSENLDRVITQRIEKDYAHFNENELPKMLVGLI